VAAYLNDPLVLHDRIVARTGSELNKAVGLARAEMVKIDLPVYILHGQQDQLAPIGGGEYMFGHISSVDKTFKQYEAGYHELFNDVGREVVVKDLLAWLGERLG
jgi:alpha-beta hydrolase superfamily lysophospholipase